MPTTLTLKAVVTAAASPVSFTEQLAQASERNQSLLCVGLDPDPSRFPAQWLGCTSRIYDFCAAIVEATADQVLAFKPQIAYFAAHAAEAQLERLIQRIRTLVPDIPVILDAKRGDIGSTAKQYAREAFERYGADAVTLSPFMGFDTIQPYLEYVNKGVFLLCRTSNSGGNDLQARRLADVAQQPLLFEHLAQQAASSWNTNGQMGLVVGATFPKELARVRNLAPKLPLLIPGVGVQGGDAHASVLAAWRPDSPIIVNVSRTVLYASANQDFAQAARATAKATRLALEAAREEVLAILTGRYPLD